MPPDPCSLFGTPPIPWGSFRSGPTAGCVDLRRRSVPVCLCVRASVLSAVCARVVAFEGTHIAAHCDADFRLSLTGGYVDGRDALSAGCVGLKCLSCGDLCGRVPHPNPTGSPWHEKHWDPADRYLVGRNPPPAGCVDLKYVSWGRGFLAEPPTSFSGYVVLFVLAPVFWESSDPGDFSLRRRTSSTFIRVVSHPDPTGSARHTRFLNVSDLAGRAGGTGRAGEEGGTGRGGARRGGTGQGGATRARPVSHPPY